MSFTRRGKTRADGQGQGLANAEVLAAVRATSGTCGRRVPIATITSETPYHDPLDLDILLRLRSHKLPLQVVPQQQLDFSVSRLRLPSAYLPQLLPARWYTLPAMLR